MRILDITAVNYKSLRDVSFAPGDFNVLVGPNNSGKSNFADCLDFLADVYENGLRLAVTRKGGFENIAYRRKTRSTAPISLGIKISVPGEAALGFNGLRNRTIHFEHDFQFRTRGRGIREEYFVNHERFLISVGNRDTVVPLLSVTRDEDGLRKEIYEVPKNLMRTVDRFSEFFAFASEQAGRTNAELFVSSRAAGLIPFIGSYLDCVAGMRIFQFSPANARLAAAPSPQPRLERYGQNLATTIDFLQRQDPHTWDHIFSAMRKIVPNVEKIEVDYTSGKLLGLFFREKGAGRPWSAAEVSDGTLQTLALLTAIFDSAASFLVLEEPENSVHPWIVRQIVEACREISQHKQILLTTHSPVVIDSVRPDELWVIWMDRHGSQMERLVNLEPTLMETWNSGTVSNSEFLDSGLLSSYTPAGFRTSLLLPDQGDA